MSVVQLGHYPGVGRLGPCTGVRLGWTCHQSDFANVQLGPWALGACSLGTAVVQLGLPTPQLGHSSQLGPSLVVVRLGQALGGICALT